MARRIRAALRIVTNLDLTHGFSLRSWDEENRLVVTSVTTSGRETVEVVHEALIRSWPTLVGWVNRDRSFIIWRNQLKPRLDEWRTNTSIQVRYCAEVRF